MTFSLEIHFYFSIVIRFRYTVYCIRYIYFFVGIPLRLFCRVGRTGVLVNRGAFQSRTAQDGSRHSSVQAAQLPPGCSCTQHLKPSIFLLYLSIRRLSSFRFLFYLYSSRCVPIFQFSFLTEKSFNQSNPSVCQGKLDVLCSTSAIRFTRKWMD